MEKMLTIEWNHIGTDVTGTCDRCSRTGTALRDVLGELQPYFQENMVTVRYREIILPDSQLEESNQILINGTPLEEYLCGAQVVQTPCSSCACITGNDGAECRAIEVGDSRFEAIPADLLKWVILGVVESGGAYCSGCGCGPAANQKIRE